MKNDKRLSEDRTYVWIACVTDISPANASRCRDARNVMANLGAKHRSQPMRTCLINTSHSRSQRFNCSSKSIARFWTWGVFHHSNWTYLVVVAHTIRTTTGSGRHKGHGCASNRQGSSCPDFCADKNYVEYSSLPSFWTVKLGSLDRSIPCWPRPWDSWLCGSTSWCMQTCLFRLSFMASSLVSLEPL